MADLHVCTNDGNCYTFSEPCSSCADEQLRLREEKAGEQLSLLSKLRRTLYLADPYNRERAADSLRRDQGRKGNYTLCAPIREPEEDDDRFGPALTRKDKELLLSEGKDMYIRREDLAAGEDAGASPSDSADGNLSLSELMKRRSVPNAPMSRDEMRRAAGG